MSHDRRKQTILIPFSYMSSKSQISLIGNRRRRNLPFPYHHYTALMRHILFFRNLISLQHAIENFKSMIVRKLIRLVFTEFKIADATTIMVSVSRT